MTQPAKVQEPSMEEILASIRRIIADDEAKPDELPVAAATASAPAPAPEARVHNIAVVPPQPAPAAKPMAARREESASMFSGAEKVVAHPAHAEADVFDLTDEMAVAAPPSFRKVEPKDDLEFAEPPPPVMSEPVPPPPPQPKPAAAHAGPTSTADILSQSTASAVESAFNSLAATVLNNNSRTLEDIVREMMRPMLKSWLDDNLPSLVERIVRAEIERVARGR